MISTFLKYRYTIYLNYLIYRLKLLVPYVTLLVHDDVAEDSFLSIEDYLEL